MEVLCVCTCAGRWEARIGVPGSKHIYLGLYASEDEAARVRLPSSMAMPECILLEPCWQSPCLCRVHVLLLLLL